MKKNIYLWVFKWHFIGGIITLPIVILLSITGIIYLFKDDYEAPLKDKFLKVELHKNRISYQDQWKIASKNWDKKITAMILPKKKDEATQFVSGRFSHQSILYINPYTGKVNGKITTNKTDMHKVRKLHGELLLGKFGTKITELVASWMIVLIITGLYLFWPKEKGWKGLFTIRTNVSKRILYRDLHAVSGFWFSLILILILGGGLPWTDVWGTGFKWIHEKTDTGFPISWKNQFFESEINGIAMPLDQVVSEAKSLNLTGEVSISLPQSKKSVYSISNQTNHLSSMSMYHLDQYSGNLLYQGSWKDIGFMMKTRLWLMAFHQGQFGLWNWILVLFTAFVLFFMSLTALFSYLKRKKKGNWGIPSTPHLKVSTGIISLIILLGLFLPMFGFSLLLIFVYDRISQLIKS